MESKLEAREIFEAINSLEDIKALLGRHEGVRLEFKRAVSGRSKLMTEDKHKYAKSISAFANEDGGVIVWGVICEPDKDAGLDVVKEFEPIEGVKALVSELNALASDATDPKVGGVENKYIFEDEKENLGYILTYVPPSKFLPHKAQLGVNDFFGRSGSNFIRLETHNIRRLFQVESQSDLTIEYQFKKRNMGERIGGRIEFLINNVGRGLATHPYIEVNFPFGWKIKQDPESEGLFNKIRSANKFVGGGNTALYPGVSYRFVYTDFRLDLEHMSNDVQVQRGNFYFKIAAKNFPLTEQIVVIPYLEMCQGVGAHPCRVFQA